MRRDEQQGPAHRDAGPEHPHHPAQLDAPVRDSKPHVVADAPVRDSKPHVVADCGHHGLPESVVPAFPWRKAGTTRHVSGCGGRGVPAGAPPGGRLAVLSLWWGFRRDPAPESGRRSRPARGCPCCRRCRVAARVSSPCRNEKRRAGQECYTPRGRGGRAAARVERCWPSTRPHRLGLGGTDGLTDRSGRAPPWTSLPPGGNCGTGAGGGV
jgi:hypothetical protein